MSATMPQTLFYKPHGVIPTMHARSTHKAQLNEDFTAAGTSVATKIWGRWALLNKISSGSWGAYMVGNITWGAPFVALIAAVTRYTLETAITAKETLEEYNKEQEERNKASFLSAIQSSHYRSLFYQNIKNKKLGKRAIKTGIKFAFVYTAWAAATKAAAILFPLFIATAFWQITVSIIAVTLVTALAMGFINWLTDGRTNKAFRKGGSRGAGEGVSRHAHRRLCHEQAVAQADQLARGEHHGRRQLSPCGAQAILDWLLLCGHRGVARFMMALASMAFFRM